MKIVFVRHGESTGNAGMPSNDLARIALTEVGRLQAAAIASAWEQEPTLIATSPYLRTQQTAAPTIARFKSVPVAVLPMEEFTYLEPSRWNGTARMERIPHIEAFWEAADPTYRDGPGAERFDDLLARLGRTFDDVARLPQGALIYAFSHGQFMQAARLRLMFPRWSSKRIMERFWSFDRESPIANTGVVIASRGADKIWELDGAD